MIHQDHTAATYVEDTRHTKSLGRAVEVIALLKSTPDDPIFVQEIADRTGAYYEEVLHTITTLEALGLVRRYARTGPPREGPKIAYAWLQPSSQQNTRARRNYKRAA